MGTTQHGASALSTNDPSSDWVHAHAQLSRLARDRAALDAEEGRWLLCAWRSEAHRHLGFASFVQYIEQLFGYKPRTIQEKLRVAEGLEALPNLARALEDGTLGWCAARELTRVAVPETESAWIDAARGKTLRELEALVASKAPGDAPHAPAPEQPRTRVLRFEVTADTFATFREAMQGLRRSAGDNLDDDAILLAMARHVLGGPRDDGRSSYQVSISVCGVCGEGAQIAAGEVVPVDAAVVAMAACDAQHLGELLPRMDAPRAANQNGAPDTDATAAASVRAPRAARQNTAPNADATAAASVRAPRAFHQNVVSDAAAGGSLHASSADKGLDANAMVAASITAPRAAPQNAASDASATAAASAEATPGAQERASATTAAAVALILEPSGATRHRSAHAHVGAPNHGKDAVAADTTPPEGAPGHQVRPSPRARQSIPPALRRAVLARDGRRCRVPGCTHATFVDVHHVTPRSEGGRNEASNLLTICSSHHRAAHRGELLIEPGRDGAFVFRHAAGAAYGQPTAPRLIDAHAKIFSALRNLGFREGEVKAVLADLRGEIELDGASVERLLREALSRIKHVAR